MKDRPVTLGSQSQGENSAVSFALRQSLTLTAYSKLEESLGLIELLTFTVRLKLKTSHSH